MDVCNCSQDKGSQICNKHAFFSSHHLCASCSWLLCAGGCLCRSLQPAGSCCPCPTGMVEGRRNRAALALGFYSFQVYSILISALVPGCPSQGHWDRRPRALLHRKGNPVYPKRASEDPCDLSPGSRKHAAPSPESKDAFACFFWRGGKET